MRREELDALWSNPGHWSRRGAYRCEADPRLVVPKRRRAAGWTVNFAHPASVPLLVGIVAVGVIPTCFGLLTGANLEMLLVAVGISAVGVLALVLGIQWRVSADPTGTGGFLKGWLRLGMIPRERLPHLEAEGIELREEGLGGSITLRNFRAPGRISLFRRNWFRGSIVLTRKRICIFTSSRSLVDVPLDDPNLRALDASVEDTDTLCIRFDPSLFDPRSSGTVEVRLTTAHARTVASRIGSGGSISSKPIG